jgi:hypothetical protein
MNRALIFVTQWLVIPVALVAVGYYVIGPRLGAPAPKASAETPPAPSLTTVDDDPKKAGSDGDPTQKFTPPDVQVSVEQGARFSVRASGPYRAHKRKRRKRSSSGPSSAPSAPAENGGAAPGGSDGGGSTTGGGLL